MQQILRAIKRLDLVEKIIKESRVANDPFFQPKIKKRNEEIKKQKEELKRKRKEIISKIKLGLQNIKKDYENENWGSNEEKLFLKMFSKLHLHIKFLKQFESYEVWSLDDKNNRRKGFFDIESELLYVSDRSIWNIFKHKFNLKDNKIQSFMQKMLTKYFEINGTMKNWCIVNY